VRGEEEEGEGSGLINYKINSKGNLTYNKKSLPTLIELVKPHFVSSINRCIN